MGSDKKSLEWVEFDEFVDEAERREKERSALSKVAELEKINEELRMQLNHDGVKHRLSQSE